MKDIARIGVVGAGHAAGQLVASLRQGGYEGSIDLFGDEAHLPYQRPPLSKAVLKGDLEPERTLLKPESWYADQRVTFHADTRVEQLAPGGPSLTLTDGTVASFDRVVLATGARPLTLPIDGIDLDGVLELRTLNDAMALKQAAASHRHAVIVGGGYIGLEAAASLRALGLDVTLVERETRVLKRVTSELISEYFEALHAERGVTVRTGCDVQSIAGDSAVEGVVLGNGQTLACDLVLVGIGIAPNVELAQDSGLDCDNGIVVDRDACTSIKTVYAIGDCTNRELVHYGRRGRLESVHNALEQAKLAAAHVLGKPRPTEDCPWFWSEQFDVKLQIAGLSDGFDDIVVRGQPAEHRFAAFYLREQMLIAVDAINSPRDFMQSKALITRGVVCDPAALADPDVALKSLA